MLKGHAHHYTLNIVSSSTHHKADRCVWENDRCIRLLVLLVGTYRGQQQKAVGFHFQGGRGIMANGTATEGLQGVCGQEEYPWKDTDQWGRKRYEARRCEYTRRSREEERTHHQRLRVCWDTHKSCKARIFFFPHSGESKGGNSGG